MTKNCHITSVDNEIRTTKIFEIKMRLIVTILTQQNLIILPINRQTAARNKKNEIIFFWYSTGQSEYVI